MKAIIKFIKLIKFKMPKNYDVMIHLCVILLMALGIVMVSSCSVGETIGNNLVVIKTLVKQIAFMVAAYLCMINVAHYFSLEKIIKHIIVLGGILVVLLLACFLFDGAGGAKSWIYITIPFLGQMSIQPSEFVKVYMIVCMACFVSVSRRHPEYTLRDIVQIPVSFFVIMAAIILVQNDTGSFLVIALICAICALIPSHKSMQTAQTWIFRLMCIGMVFVLFLMTTPGMEILSKFPIGAHIVKRFEMSANPWVDEYGNGLQLINSLYAFASGGLSGLGLGQSIQKMKYLPAASTDYILAITVEELGIFGFLYILIGYSIIIFKLISYALNSKREGYKIVYIGTALFIFIHFIFNVGGVTGLIPLTGIPLLFISAGASSLVSICSAIGICQALISKENSERKAKR